MNLLASLLGTESETQPLHVGEVMTLWALLTAVNASKSLCMTLLNHTRDADLRTQIKEIIVDMEEPAARKLEEFLRKEGIPQSFQEGEKPKADEAEVPAGAKFTDAEIANLLVVKLQGATQVLNAGMVQSLRTDVIRIQADYYLRVMAKGSSLKQLMHRRGWLHIPPPYHPGGKVSAST